MGTIAKGARCYGATGVLAVALWERGQGGDRGGISKIIPPGPAPTGVAVIDGATSASIAGTVVTVNVPVQPAGQVYHVMLDCLFA